MTTDMPGDNIKVPQPGHWPVEPQEDVPIGDKRIWIDGCFDFSHHGHAGAMLQARRLGTDLLVGIHSDDDILENKGPTVMNLKERVSAVDACRWSTLSVPHAPYVTSLPWISHYGCRFVVHGDDITSDSNGEDCYRYVKQAGRFLVVKRTPGISTTDLVGRMLLCTKTHFVHDLTKYLVGDEGPGSETERNQLGAEMSQRIREYAADETGLSPGPEVWTWHGSNAAKIECNVDERGEYTKIVPGNAPLPGQRVVYVDGGFDLFSSGHIEFLKQVGKAEEEVGRLSGWYQADQFDKRKREQGKDYSPAFIVAGVHDDHVINHWKGLNYPIMNIFERGLCVLQCRYIDSVIFSAPFSPNMSYLQKLAYYGTPDAIYHGPTTFMPLTYDPYLASKKLGIFKEIGNHDFGHVNAEEIVKRILKSRDAFEARQRMKGEKAVGEEAVRMREQMEQEALKMQSEREKAAQ